MGREASNSRSDEYFCSLCSKGRIHKSKSKKPVYLPSMLYHLTRKQKRQILQHFPLFNENLKARRKQFFIPFVTCCICSEDIKDNEEALIPPVISSLIHFTRIV